MGGTTMAEYRTWLIQRLTKPYKGGQAVRAPSVAYRDALLADDKTAPRDIMDMRSGVFGFDYMGSAEFEFGAIPRALREMARNAAEFKSSTLTIKAADIAQPWRGKPAAKDGTVYLLCRPMHREHAESVIRRAAKDDRSLRLKEMTRLPSMLNPAPDDRCDIGGWLELDNLFWFFVDKKMRDGVCALFGVSP